MAETGDFMYPLQFNEYMVPKGKEVNPTSYVLLKIFNYFVVGKNTVMCH